MTIDTKPIPISIAATDAPHSNHTMRHKNEHYNYLEKKCDEWKPHEMNLCVGDFNARLMEQLPRENTIIGRHTSHTTASNIQDLSEPQKENRHLFTNFCLSRKMIAVNTCYEKLVPLLATYRNPNTTKFNRQAIDASTHAQLDCIRTNDR